MPHTPLPRPPPPYLPDVVVGPRKGGGCFRTFSTLTLPKHLTYILIMGHGSPPNTPDLAPPHHNGVFCYYGVPFTRHCAHCPPNSHSKCPNGIYYGQPFCNYCPPLTHRYYRPPSTPPHPATVPPTTNTPPPKPSPTTSSYHTPEPSRLRQAIEDVLRNIEEGPVPKLPPFPTRQNPDPNRTFLDLPNHYLFDVIMDPLHQCPRRLPGPCKHDKRSPLMGTPRNIQLPYKCGHPPSSHPIHFHPILHPIPSPDFPSTLPTQSTTVPAPGTPSPAPIPVPNAPPRQPSPPRQP
jgi:hypothetical protein